MSEKTYRGGWDNTNPDQFQGSSSDQIRRVWLKKGTSGEFIILDDDSKAHVFEVDGRRVKVTLPYLENEAKANVQGKWTTFVQPTTPCGIPRKKFRDTAFFTVVDLREWVDRNGNTHKCEKKLLAIATWMPVFQALAKIARREDMTGKVGLRGLKIELSRTNGPQSAGVGDAVLPLGRIELGDTFSHGGVSVETSVYNYPEILKPLPAAEINKLMGLNADGTPVSTQSDDSSADAEEDMSIPF